MLLFESLFFLFAIIAFFLYFLYLCAVYMRFVCAETKEKEKNKKILLD